MRRAAGRVLCALGRHRWTVVGGYVTVAGYVGGLVRCGREGCEAWPD